MAPGKNNARFPGLAGKVPVFPDARAGIDFKAVPCQLSIGKGNSPEKGLPIDCICQFAAIERRNANSRLGRQAAQHFRRLRITNVCRNEKAGIDVDDQ